MSSDWRPNVGELAEAQVLLLGRKGAWAKRRLGFLAALTQHPTGSCQQIAKTAGTRRQVIARFLEKWEEQGVESVGSFGCPRELTMKLVAELRAELTAGRLASVVEVTDWLAKPERAGVEFSAPTVRKYCRELGFPLPANAALIRATPKHVWTAEQLKELKRLGRKLGSSRVKAILLVGTTDQTIKRVAIEGGVDYRRLLLDLKYFEAGRLEQAIKHTPAGRILVVRGVGEEFSKWCAGQYNLNGCVPSAVEAQAFLKSNYKISLARSTVYSHLNGWQKRAGIPRRRYARGKKPTASDGLRVRSIL